MPKTKATRSKSKAATEDSRTLRAKKAALQDEFGKAKKTKENYKGYYDRGIRILKDIPNKHSVYALELYLTQKCVVEELGQSTADGIHGAMADYWDRLEGGQYNGKYSLDEETGKVTGNPARAPPIVDFVKCIKNKSRVKGAAATRNHAEATTFEDMQQFMEWSQLDLKAKDGKDLVHMIEHGLMRAFLSSGFVLWTRAGPQHGQGTTPYYLPYLGVFLDNRKGWQKKQGYDGPLESNHYQIYAQKDTPEIDMFDHVHRWRTLYRHVLGREFEPDDYLFPYISSNGTIHAKKPMTHDHAQELINKFALGAKISKTFTTHCLRQGGSQYRFMFAPIGKRWSLSIIRWWGGWAVGEQVDTLMRYLLDSLQSYKTGHGDALYPFRTEPDKSFMGEHNALQPPSTADDSSDDENSDPSTAFIPISGAIIPGVGKDSNAWKRAVDQWYHGDPAQGLMVALKDWPLSWYTGQMRLKTGALYCNRRLLAEEYECMGCDEKKFMEVYPEYPKITQLLKAIRQRKGLVRKSS
ncbi:hypothetical protein R3P38DRAFT_3576197 [Favolaschia claudopus]|uniref:Integrase n=1 Tax=Favolaschia claudopus TaxID=2862362 RepID=A0AAW0ALB0_9AGAR